VVALAVAHIFAWIAYRNGAGFVWQGIGFLGGCGFVLVLYFGVLAWLSIPRDQAAPREPTHQG
jgi:hypothetical protein